jgi:uncharacterized protein YebE (UPF0316 family)
MEQFLTFDSLLFKWLLLPLFIFVAKIIEVSVGTMRLIFIARKEKKLVLMVAFVEVLIWILTIGIIFANLTNIMAYLAYAVGFATGNRMGMAIEEKMAIGNSMVRVITKKRAKKLVTYLKKEKFAITSTEAASANGHVNLIEILLPKKSLKKVLAKIKRFNPRAFLYIEDVLILNEGMMPLRAPVVQKTPISARLWGKRK